jgi:hypothetical protein
LFDYLPGIAVLVLIITGLIETFLSATWSKTYFNSGVLGIIKNAQVGIHHTNVPSHSLFESKFRSGYFYLTRSLVFKELDINVYGFRESLFPLGRMSLLHGVLVFDDDNNQVIVKGFFDWTALCFVLIWLMIPPLAWLFGYMSFYEPTWLVALAYFGILFVNLGIFYSMDYFRFSAVAEFAAQSWSRKYVNTVEG